MAKFEHFKFNCTTEDQQEIPVQAQRSEHAVPGQENPRINWSFCQDMVDPGSTFPRIKRVGHCQYELRGKPLSADDDDLQKRISRELPDIDVEST